MKSSLYSVIQEDLLTKMLQAFYTCVDLPIKVFDAQGTLVRQLGETVRFCRLFQAQLNSSSPCNSLYGKASQDALRFGGTYIFTCMANLNNIVFPIIYEGAVIGSVLVGPFFLDKPDSLLIQDIGQRYPMPTDKLLDLYDEADRVRIIAPAMATQISNLLYFLFFSLVADSKQQLKSNRELLHQQSAINDSIQYYKAFDEIKDIYPMEKEKELITYFKVGDLAGAEKIMSDLLGHVLSLKNSSLEMVKARAIEICALLSRTAIDSGALSDNVFQTSNSFTKSLDAINDFEKLSNNLLMVMKAFSAEFFSNRNSKGSDAIREARKYIVQNYPKPLQLEAISSMVHLNPAYFSTLFKQSTGMSFREYLNMVRIEQSKRLLANHKQSILAVALAVGYDNQSYFAKVFKSYTGLTPKQYRQT